MGFFLNISTDYGERASELLKRIRRLKVRLSNAENRKNFLIRCRRHHVFPSFIINNIKCLDTVLPKAKKYQRRVEKLTLDFKKRILNLEISVAFDDIYDLKNEVSKVIDQARLTLPVNVLDKYLGLQNDHANKLFTNGKERLIRKFNNLIREQNKFNIVGCLDNIENFSGVQIPNDVAKLLALGPNHAIQPTNKEINVKHLVSDLEYGISKLNVIDAEKDIKRGEAVNIVTNFLSDASLRNVRMVPGGQQYRDTKKFLKEHKDLVVLNSDKGNKTCVLKKSDYEEKMNNLLSDADTYLKIKKDPTNVVQTKSNALAKKLLDNKCITEEERSKLTRYNSVISKAYGNPKFHKPGLPLRPIVSSINTATTNLSMFVVNILNNIQHTCIFNVKNSFEASETLKTAFIPDGYCLVSFDVVSLFTNVTRESVCRCISEIWSDISEHTDIPELLFLEIVRFLFDNSFLQYNNQIYKQIVGCAMGSNSSPSFADVVMTNLLKRFIRAIDFPLPYLQKFVDDIDTAIPEDKIDNCLEILNSLENKIKFTFEVETNGTLPFLDMLLVRKDNRILIDLYKKPISSNRVLNFKSHHPLHQKISVIKMMKNKIDNLCSDEFKEKNFNLMRKTLLENNYPRSVINNIINNQELKSLDPNDKSINKVDLDQKKFFKVPFHNQLAPKINWLFKNSNQKAAFYNTKTNKSFFGKVKDKTPVLQQSELVYELNCQCKMKYIGQTKQSLKARLQQHNYDINKSNSNTGLSAHVTSTKHEIDFDNVKILDKQSNDQKRLFLEFAHIITNPEDQILNKQTDYKEGSVIYRNILKKGATLFDK